MRDEDKDDVTNPPRHRPKVNLPKPALPKPRREQHRPDSWTPPATKKDEQVVR